MALTEIGQGIENSNYFLNTSRVGKSFDGY